MCRVPIHTQNMASRIVEAIGGQLIEEKLAKEFEETNDEPGSPDHTTEGACETDEEETAPKKKSTLAQALDCDASDIDEVCISFCCDVFFVLLYCNLVLDLIRPG